MKIENRGVKSPLFRAVLRFLSSIIGEVLLFFFAFCLEAIHFAEIEFRSSTIFIQ